MSELYARHERYWFRLCLRYAQHRSDAQDMLQDGLVNIFKDLEQFDAERGSFQAWSNRVLVNAALRFLKKHQWQASMGELDLAEKVADLNPSAYGQISARELTHVIQQLPTGYRLVFNMYEIEGYSHQEIADTLEISVGTSKSQLSKAKRALREQLNLLFNPE